MRRFGVSGRWSMCLVGIVLILGGCGTATRTAGQIDNTSGAASPTSAVVSPPSADVDAEPAPRPDVDPDDAGEGAVTPDAQSPLPAPTATTGAPTDEAPTPAPDAVEEAPSPVPAVGENDPVPSPTPEPSPTPPVEPTSDTAEILAMSSLEPVECPEKVRARRVTCSFARIPESVDEPDPAAMVEIFVALVDNGDPNDVGPVVYLQGGPGVGSVEAAPNFAGAAHDVLFVDQRGTGYSTPKLRCPEVDEQFEALITDIDSERIDDDAEVFDAYARCHTRLVAEGISLDDYNTTAAATDIEILRQLFGYEQWSLWGSSYGTRLGLTVMRDHPDGVRAAVLDSIVPFEVDFFASTPAHALRSIEALGQACINDTACTNDHGDFETNLAALVQRLNDEPIVISATRPVTGATFPFRVDGEQLINMVFTQLYSTQSLQSLPRQIARPDTGGLNELVASYLVRRDPAQFDLSTGLYYTTWCREEFPFHDPTADDALLAELEPRYGEAIGRALGTGGVPRLCEIFDVAAADPADDQPLASDIPTLVFAGAFDPITPPLWSKQVADMLTNATYVEMSDHGHGMATACPIGIRLDFLIDPTGEPDVGCSLEAGAPNFD